MLKNFIWRKIIRKSNLILTLLFVFLLQGSVYANDILSTSKQTLGNYIVGAISNSTPDFIKYFDMEYTFSADSEDTFSITTLSSISEDDESLMFNQTSIYRSNDNTTVNMGFGYRSFLNDDKMILGANVFYDREVEVTHQRVGIGLELLTSIFDLRSNLYEAFSDKKLVANNDIEKALDGWDVRLDYHLPATMVDGYDVTFFTSYYDWSESGGTFSVDGYKIGFSSRLYKNLYIEAGLDDDNKDNQDFYLVMNYAFKFFDNENNVSENRTQGSFEFESVKHRLYEKVLRENRIIKVVKGAVKVKRGN